MNVFTLGWLLVCALPNYSMAQTAAETVPVTIETNAADTAKKAAEANVSTPPAVVKTPSPESSEEDDEEPDC